MGGELAAALVVLLDLLLVDGSDLRQLVLVIGVLDGRTVLAKSLCWSSFIGALKVKNPSKHENR